MTDASGDPTPPDAPELHVAHAVPPETAADLVDAPHADGRVPPGAITRGDTVEETEARLPHAEALATFGLTEE